MANDHINVNNNHNNNVKINKNNINNDNNCNNHNNTKIRDYKDSNDDVFKLMAFQKVRDKMEIYKAKMVEEFDNKMDIMVEDLLNELKRFDLQNNELKQLFKDERNDKLMNNRKKSDRNGQLPEKQFIHRNSLLTDLFEVKHIRTIYHIFIVILIIMFLNTIVHDFVEHGKINIGLGPIKTSFGKLNIVFYVWSGFQMLALSVFPVFILWARIRNHLNINKYNTLRVILDVTAIIVLITYYVMMFILSTKAVIGFNLPIASSIIILMEMIRFLMKSHAFVRSNVPRIINNKVKIENDKKIILNLPIFSKYLYFLFVPTLIYRDEYPRTKQIRWSMVAWNYLEVIGVIFYLSFIFERFLIPFYRQFGLVQIPLSGLVLSMFGTIMPSIIIFLCGFYCLLHAWMNAAAELLRFGDRMFYKDWWNASSFDVYYRTWNVVVHDWLYTYIYKDMYEHVLKGSKVGSTIVVFTISAAVHEFILSFAFGFFYPIMFLMFEGAGVFFMFVTKKEHKAVGNIIMWLSLCLGNGIMFSLYNIESFARRNCVVGNTILDFFIPVSWSCHGITYNPDWRMQTPWM